MNDSQTRHNCSSPHRSGCLLVVVTNTWHAFRAVTRRSGQMAAKPGVAGPVLLMLLMVIAVVVGPIPTLPVSATAGLAFGVIGGTTIAATGALIGALIAFWVARSLGREAICQRFPDNPILARDGSQRFLTLAIVITRLIPVFSFALISYAAGVTAIHTWRFAIATLIGMLPMTVVLPASVLRSHSTRH